MSESEKERKARLKRIKQADIDIKKHQKVEKMRNNLDKWIKEKNKNRDKN